MTQLVFDAADVREALGQKPTEIGYSSHEGAERAMWGDEKLEIVDGTHPVVYPAAGSHANKFTAALYLGQLGRRRRRLRQHGRPAPRGAPGGEDDPERRRGGRQGVPVDRVRGPVGGARVRVLQRPDGPEHEDAVDEPDRLVAGLARSELRRAGGRRFRDRGDRSLLPGCREGLEGPRAAPQEPGRDAARPRRDPRADRLRRDSGDMAPRGAAANRAAAKLGSDHLDVGPRVRATPTVVPRPRR